MKKRLALLFIVMTLAVSILSGCRARQAPAPENVPPPPPESESTQ
ncbi:MAG: hypothetical protein AB1714_22140 [Acidobacteriota bacterium]